MDGKPVNLDGREALALLEVTFANLPPDPAAQVKAVRRLKRLVSPWRIDGTPEFREWAATTAGQLETEGMEL